MRLDKIASFRDQRARVEHRALICNALATVCTTRDTRALSSFGSRATKRERTKCVAGTSPLPHNPLNMPVATPLRPISSAGGLAGPLASAAALTLVFIRAAQSQFLPCADAIRAIALRARLRRRAYTSIHPRGGRHAALSCRVQAPCLGSHQLCANRARSLRDHTAQQGTQRREQNGYIARDAPPPYTGCACRSPPGSASPLRPQHQQIETVPQGAIFQVPSQLAGMSALLSSSRSPPRSWFDPPCVCSHRCTGKQWHRPSSHRETWAPAVVRGG